MKPPYLTIGAFGGMVLFSAVTIATGNPGFAFGALIALLAASAIDLQEHTGKW